MSVKVNTIHSVSQSNVSNQTEEEIGKLEKSINDSLKKIELLQEDLKDLQEDLNKFFDHYYASGSISFSIETSSPQADNDNSSNLNEAKKNLYSKIARVCSQDNLNFHDQHTHDGLLKIEDYLNKGKELSQSPQDLLESLVFEYCNLSSQMNDLKDKEQELLENLAYQIKQEIIWANVKTSETISKIKEDLTSHVNRPN